MVIIGIGKDVALMWQKQERLKGVCGCVLGEGPANCPLR